MSNRIALPAVPTWDPKFSQANLQLLSGTRQFDRGFRMMPITEGELMFPHFESCFEASLAVGSLLTRRLPTYIGVDLSSPRRPGNFIVALGLDLQNGLRIPLEVRHGAWTSPETAEHIADVAGRHATEWVMVENNAYQDSIIDWMKANRNQFPFWQRIDSFTTGKNKADENYGLPGLEVEFKNKAWSVPSAEWAGHKTTCVCSWCVWRNQIRLYPRASATDGVMATWFALSAITRYSHFLRQQQRRSALGNLNLR